MMILFEKDSVLDFVGRGYTRAQIMALLGCDVGYHGSSVAAQLRGVDRLAYKAHHIAQRYSAKAIECVLDGYARGDSVGSVIEQLGLGASCGQGGFTLRKIFASDALSDFTDTFTQADKRRRTDCMRAGMQAKTGVDNPFKLADVQKRAAQTRTDRYGAAYTLAHGSTLEAAAREKILATTDVALVRRQATLQNSYGVSVPMLVPGARDKARATAMKHWGYDHPAKRPCARKRASQWMLEHSDEVQVRSKQTCLQKYGVPVYTMTPEAREAQSVRMSSDEARRQYTEALVAHDTVHVSSPEKALRELLVERFGEDDVVSQYWDERYPFACDFYILSRDLFIELNGLWTHGYHWFDANSAMDAQTLAKWRARAQTDSAYFGQAAYVWTDLDVRKRAAAREHKLNYVVLWNGQTTLYDAKLWLCLGTPDGHDWEREYSWLPYRELTLDSPWPETLRENSRCAIAIARRATWRSFYARELALWRDDATWSRRWGRTRAWVLANRLGYLKREPQELTDFEILRGMGIAGLVRAYSVFDNTAMREVLDAYTPARVYDPCAGWGERLVTCAARQIDYLGVDIRSDVVVAHQSIIDHYGLDSVRSTVADAAVFDASGFDAEMVFTCPPYGGIEIYSEQGAENLSETEFLAWWEQVVRYACGPSTRVFAFQVNRAWGERMAARVSACGWHQTRAIRLKTKSAHYTRGADGVSRKREYESVLVFERA